MAFPTPGTIAETVGADTPATTHSVDLPATVGAGDMLLVFVNFYVTGASSGDDVTPSGWTEVGSVDYLGGDTASQMLRVYAKVAVGDEDGTALTVESTVNSRIAAQSVAISAWDGTLAGVKASTGVAGTLDNSPNSGSLTGFDGAEDILWWSIFSCADDLPTLNSNPTNYTAGAFTQMNSGINDSCSLGSAHRQLNASSEDPGAFGLSEIERWNAVTVAVRPDTGGGAGNTLYPAAAILGL